MYDLSEPKLGQASQPRPYNTKRVMSMSITYGSYLMVLIPINIPVLNRVSRAHLADSVESWRECQMTTPTHTLSCPILISSLLLMPAIHPLSLVIQYRPPISNKIPDDSPHPPFQYSPSQPHTHQAQYLRCARHTTISVPPRSAWRLCIPLLDWQEG